MYVQAVDFKSTSAGAELAASLRDTGFGVIANHHIQADLIAEIYAEWQQFFNSERKHDYLYNKERLDGYFPFRSENASGYDKKNLSEFYNLYKWGVYPTELSRQAIDLHGQLTSLASTLLSWVQENTPEEITRKFYKTLPEMIKDSPRHLMRIINYPAFNGNEEPGAIRSFDHFDMNFITLLPAATSPGLQVMDNDGQWHDVVADPGTIVINVGDMLALSSGNYYRSTLHRVINPIGLAADEARMSMPIFIHPHDEYNLTDEVTAGGFRLQRMRENGLI